MVVPKGGGGHLRLQLRDFDALAVDVEELPQVAETLPDFLGGGLYVHINNHTFGFSRQSDFYQHKKA